MQSKYLPVVAASILAVASADCAAATKNAVAAPSSTDSAFTVHSDGLYQPDKYPTAATPAAPTAPVAQNAAIPAPTLPLKPIDPPLKPIDPPKAADPGTSVQTWITDGEWLRPALDAWAEKAGWHILWLDANEKPLPPDVDRHLVSALKFSGDFQSAVQQCIELYASRGDHLAFDSWAPNRVITITETN